MPLACFWNGIWLQQNILPKCDCFISSWNSEPWCPRGLWLLPSKLLPHPQTIPNVTSLLRDRTCCWFMLIFFPGCNCPGDWLTHCCQKKEIIKEFSQFWFPGTTNRVSFFNNLFRRIEQGVKEELIFEICFFGSWLKLVRIYHPQGD